MSRTPRLRCLLLTSAPPSGGEDRLARHLRDSERVDVVATRATVSPGDLRRLCPDVVVLDGDHTPAATLAATWWQGFRVVRVGPTRGASGLDRALGVHALQPGDAATTARDLARLAGRPGRGGRGSRPVSVVVPALNEARVIDQVLEPLLPQLRDDDEVLVVDSGSVDGTRERLRDWSVRDPRVRLVEVDPCTIAGSRNHGVRRSRHDLVACTDAGCRVDPGWLEAFRAAFEDVEDPTLLTGVYAAHVGDRLFEAAFAAVAWPDAGELRRAALPWRVWLRTIGPQYSGDRVDGRSVAFTRSAYDAAGGFREDLLTAEDEAFGRDAIEGGAHHALVPDATVVWFQRSSARLAFRQFRGYGRGAATSGSPMQRRVDLVRGAGYLCLAALGASPRPSHRRLALAGGAAILAFPAARIVRRGDDPRALAVLPAAQLVKDVGKLTGVVEATWLGRTGPLARPE